MTVQLSLVAFQLRWQHAILSKLNNKPNPSSCRQGRPVSGRHTTPIISVCYSEWIDFNLLFNQRHSLVSHPSHPLSIPLSNLCRVRFRFNFVAISQKIEHVFGIVHFTVFGCTYRDTTRFDTFNVACQLLPGQLYGLELAIQINFYRFQSVFGITNVTECTRTRTVMGLRYQKLSFDMSQVFFCVEDNLIRDFRSEIFHML